MNCPETELTKSCIFLSAMLIAVPGFNIHFQISPAIFAPNHKAFIAGELLMVVGTPDAWAVNISIQHVTVGMQTPCKTSFVEDFDFFAP